MTNFECIMFSTDPNGPAGPAGPDGNVVGGVSLSVYPIKKGQKAVMTYTITARMSSLSLK